jgi:methane/ammonia monooxygenase subunit B
MLTTMLKSLMHGAKRQAGRLFALGLAVGVASVATVASVGTAEAHGEKSQAAFLRMRTLNWYDVKWSKTSLNVNEEFEITGKLRIMEAWPVAVQVPDVAFLNVGEPGPVAVRKASFVGGQFAPRSLALEVGKEYDFRIILKARREGRWHVHTQLSVQTGGPIPGPGQWIEIKGNLYDFKNPVTLLNGTVIDLEQYGIGEIYGWHLLWFIIGFAWVGYWFSKRGFVGRFLWVASGKGEELITPNDTKVGIGSLAAILLIVGITWGWAAAKYPNTLPLQAGNLKNIVPLPDQDAPIKIKYEGGDYKVPGRELAATYTITNTGKEPLRIGEFATAGLRFLNPDVYTSKVEYPDYLLADKGLFLSDNSPIQPGETKKITVTARDARWDIERLSGLSYDVDSSFAGLLFFFTPTGQRYHLEVGGFVIPTFISS